MNTDLHVHIEVKSDGTWHHLAQPNMARNDILFRLLGGSNVRACKISGPDELPCVTTKMGLPDDISYITRKSYTFDLAAYDKIHHAGMLDKNAIKRLQTELIKASPESSRYGTNSVDLEDSVFKTFVNGNLIHQHAGYDDVRIIFWFDD